MATWKKVVVSGSSAELAALKVDNLTSGQVVIGGGQAANLSTTAINGTGNIVATTAATGLSHSGSFSGSFQGSLTGTATQVSNNLTQGTGVTAFTYNGASAQTVAVSGASTLSTNAVTKWTGTAFANSSLTDNGTTITGATSIQLTGANSNLSGSFSGSFRGDGSGLTGVTAQASYALTFGEGIGLNAQGSSSYNGSQAVTVTVSGAVDLTDNNVVKWNNTANKFAPSSISDDGTTVSGTTSVRFSGANSSLTGSFSGNLTGSAATASYFNFSSVNQNVTITGSLTLSGSTAPELIIIGETQFSGSVNSRGGFTGSLFGTASYVTGSIFSAGNLALSASYAVTAGFASSAILANSLTAGAGLTGTTFNGSAASTFDVGAGALITVQADAVMVTTSSLIANQIPKFSNNTLSGSNISDNGTTITLASATNISAGGLTVTGNSTFNNSVNIVGNLSVAGTASFTNTDSLFVADKFIALASGSTTVADSGLIVITSTVAGNMSGSAFYLESTTDAAPNYGRWAVAANVHATASVATADEYMVTAKIGQASNPSVAPTWGGDTQGRGNMWITTAGDIFIYS